MAPQAVAYENGPIDGQTNAFPLNFGYVVSDTFTLTEPLPLDQLTFGAWLFPGDTLQSVEVSITSSEFGGTTYFDQVLSFRSSGCFVNDLGFDVCTESGGFNYLNLPAGTYWLNLQNASVNTGDPVYWDQNSGVGCHSQGCPSLASEASLGTIPSESFSVLWQNCFSPQQNKPASEAKAVSTPPSPTLNYRVIYNFTGNSDGGLPVNALALDAEGNLYGTAYGGASGYGIAFKLTPGVSGWRFNRLYSFSSASGAAAGPLVLAGDGRPVGATSGGNGSNGTIFELSPPGHVSPSVFSNWMETVLYGFGGGDDGSGPRGSLILDDSGNIFGTTVLAGANYNGTLYEFSNGSLQVLHAFPAFRGDGYSPMGVVAGANGLFGLTSGGGSNGTGALYTTIGGYQIINNFGQYETPLSLASDLAGNAYTANTFENDCSDRGTNITQFSPPNWTPSVLATLDDLDTWIATDTAGNIYGTFDVGGQHGQGSLYKLSCCWTYTVLHDFAGGTTDGGTPVAAPIIDSHGNIYGTTELGGSYGYGTVWEITP